MTKAAAKNIAVSILLLSVAGMLAGFTVDAPHGTGNGYSCADCHTGHATLGSSGFNNICLSCHRVGIPAGGNRPFSPADQADPFAAYTAARPVRLLQTSHRFEGSDTVPRAGAQPPLFPALTSVRGRTGGALACVRCHNQHDNAIPPLLRGPNDRDQLCLDCHRSLDRRGHESGTHPVNFGYTDPGSKAVLLPAQYRVPPVNANPANPTSDLAAQLKGGKLLCSSCHGVHYADSSSATFDSYSSYLGLSAGDGRLLRTDARGAAVGEGQNDNLNICTNCHAGKRNHNYRGQDVQCLDCHGAHVDPGDGSAPNSFLIRRFMNISSAAGRVRNRPVFSRATSAGSASLVDPNGTGVCQACHQVPPGVTDKHGLVSATAGDCSECHFHNSSLGSFSGGCTTCHGYPITASTTGGPHGLATPATGALGGAPATPGAHATHVTAKAIQCLACHSGYTATPMGNDVVEMGFGVTPGTWSGFTGQVTSGTIFVNSSLNPGYSWSAGAGTTLVQAPGQEVSCSVYCHGTTLTGGSVTRPVWTGTAQASCGSCHGVSAALPPTAGSHPRHAGNGTSLGRNNLSMPCAACHGDVSDKRHVNGTLVWDVSQLGAGSLYKGAASGSTGIPAPSPSYGQCGNVYCHSSVQGTGGNGAPAVFAQPVWGGAPLGCDGCHQSDMTAASATGSHRAHFASTIWSGSVACDSCHPAAGGGSAAHANGQVEIAFPAAGSYSQSPNPAGNGYGSCSGISCHAGSSAAWGTSLPGDCSGCHGGDQASLAPMAAGAHRAHMNNYSTLGRGNSFTCDACHAATAAGNRTLARPALHIDGLANYSGARAGRIAAPGSGACSTSYCHSNGSAALAYWNMTGARWDSGRRLSCNGCHGGPHLPDGTAPGFPDILGEPNYANSGAGTAHANSHKKHVFDAGITVTTGCALCHGSTVDAVIPDKLKDDSTAHLDGTRTISFKAIGGVQGRYSSATRQCNNTYCHSGATPAWGGTSLACNGCHQADNTLPGQHGRHWESALPAASYVDLPGNLGSATAYQFSCSSCHGTPAIHAAGPVSLGQSAEVQFSYSSATRRGSYAAGVTGATDGSFGYSFGSCSATYCHSDGNGGDPAVTAFTWSPASPALGCDGCHANQGIGSGRHGVHVASAGYSCSRCHSLTVDAAGLLIDKRRHVNKAKDVEWDALNAGGAPYAAGACASVYCHSPGTSLTPPYPAPAVLPTWGGSLPGSCGGCHGGLATGPDYQSGQPKANSHAKHVVVGGIGCNACHAGVTGDGTTITDRALHIDRSFNLTPGSGASFTVTAAGSSTSPASCSDISCHGGGGRSATWGVPLVCHECHLSAAADLDNFTLPFTTSSPEANLNLAQWTGTGHGRPAGSYRSGNQAAGFSGAGQCLYCHNPAVGHNTPSNWFRFLNYSSATWGRNMVCQACHAAASAGVSALGATLNSTLKVDSTHFGARHNQGRSGGRFCWDCHDPHGDGNDYMIHDSVAPVSDGASGAPVSQAAVSFVLAQAGSTSWSDFVKPGFNGICQGCHSPAATDPVLHFTTASYDTGHNFGINCTGCHPHSGPGPDLAFQPAGTCDSCHGYPPAPAGFTGSAGNWGAARAEDYPGGGGAHLVAKHVNKNALPSEGFANCDRCHQASDHQTSPTRFQPSSNIRVRVNARFAFENGKLANYSSNRLDGASHVTGVCSNINCHFGASPKWDPLQ